MQEQQAHLYLVGMMGCGKSTVGPLLADLLGRPFYDLDEIIVAYAGKAISDIFREEGEIVFREWESFVLRELADCPAGVAATGGGIVLAEDNRRRLKRTGRCAWLDASPEVLVSRVGDGSSRPVLSGQLSIERVEELHAERAPMYRDVAGIRIDTAHQDPRQLAQALAGWFMGRES